MTISYDKAAEPAPAVSNLVELLRRLAADAPGRRAFSFTGGEDGSLSALTYGELETRARAVAGLLRGRVSRGERALLFYHPSAEFVAAFFGCLYCGVIPVPLPPPEPKRLSRTLPRLRALIDDARPATALTTSTILNTFADWIGQVPALEALRPSPTDDLAPAPAEVWRADWSDSDGATPAALLYTSGPVYKPKGVMHTHASLLDNMDGFGRHCGLSGGDVVVSWLPHYTAFGLIFGVLQHLLTGAQSCLMPPLSFVKWPARWLQAITDLGATHTAAPNFAYDHCVREIAPEQRALLDLSRLRMAGNGAEFIRAETLRRFSQAFAPTGFRAQAFCPVYGLSEAMVVSSGVVGETPAEAQTVGGGGREAVSCGRPLPRSKVIVVDPESMRECAPGEAGEVWVSSRSVAPEYWGRSEETRRTLQARPADGDERRYLRTGDLGLIREGEVYLTGRLKDLIISRGQNHYPEDIEQTVGFACPELSAAARAAFSIDVDDEEQPVLLAETGEPAADAEPASSAEPVVARDFAGLIESVRQAVVEYHGLRLHAVALLPRGALPRRPGGGVDRAACREAFLSGRLPSLAGWQRSGGEAGAAAAGRVREELLPLSGDERERRLIAYLGEGVAEVLGVAAPRLDARKSLMSLGVDSLLTIELKNRIESDLGLSVSAADLLAAPSVADLARDLAAALASGGDASTAPPAESADTDEGAAAEESAGEYPLSYNQRSLWFINQLAPESPAYNVAFVVRVVSELDVPALGRAFRELVARHPALRTTYAAREGDPAQSVHPEGEVNFTEHDGAALNDAELNSRLAAEAARPFDLSADAPLRVSLWTRSARDRILLLSIHHIAIDFWSLEIMIAELATLYQAEVEGGSTPPPPPPSGRYTDYVRWQARMLAGAQGARLWDYWREELAGELPALELPADRPRPPVQTYRGASHPFTIDEEATRRLKAFAREEGATLYMTLLAAFFTLLYRYTGQPDVVVGSPAAGRSQAGWEEVVGYFVNPIALRASLSGDESFRSLLGRVRRTALGALKHQDFPFPLLVERLQPRRDPSRSPVFQAMFVLEKPYRAEDEVMSRFVLGEPGARVTLGRMDWESYALGERVSQFDLMLMMVEAGGAIFASMPYNSDLFDAATITRMAGHFRTLLGELVAHPERPLGQLELLSEGERRQLLREWNDTGAHYPRAACVHHLFAAQAARTPDAVAVVFGDAQLTYAELNQRADVLARRLRGMGVGPESPVAICVERSLEMIVGVLGILKAGGAYVPLDPAYPAARLAWMLEDARAPVLLTQTRLLEKLPQHSAAVLCLDSEASRPGADATADGGRGQDADGGAGPDNLAYVIYTSGSTGKPKGVMIRHGSAVNLAYAHQRAIYAGGRVPEGPLRVSLNAPLTFDGCVERLLLLLFGHALHILPEELRHDPREMIEYVESRRLDVLDFTPSQLKPLVEAGLLERPRVAVTLALVGGEPIDEQLWRLLSAHPRADFFNVYGPTECTVNAAVCRVRESAGQPTVGRPLPNVEVYILDRHDCPVPVGVAGEIYVGGEGLARGYLNGPALTAEKFVPHPWGREPGARLYRTGDLARYRADGRIEFLGRADQQIKIRGFRVEPGEIESVLKEHPRVKEVAVVVEERDGDRRLVAHLVPPGEAGEPPASADLRKFLRERVPPHMIPAEFVPHDALPVTPAGKLDLRALASAARPAPAADDDFVAPRTSSEQRLADIWAQLLRRERVGVNDNFFDLGGHSLLATQMVMRVRQSFGVDLPLRSVFESHTLADLHLRLLQQQLQQGEGEALLDEIENLPEDELRRLLDDDR